MPKRTLLRPLAKRLVLAVAIAVGIGIMRAWFGEHSPLIAVLTGTGAYIFADWLLSTKPEREVRIRQAAVFFRSRRTTAATWAVYVLLGGYFFGSLAEPQAPAVTQLLSLVQTLGLVVVLLVPIAYWAITAVAREELSVSGLMSRFLSSMTLYAMALWSIGYAGDGLYEWVLANTHDSAIGTVALVIVWTIFRFADRPAYRREIAARPTAAAALLTAFPTPRDNRYTAAHEAGHALVYAALGCLPDKVQLVINEHVDHSGVLGFVTGIRSPHRLDEATFAEWRMLVLLAGKVGESRMMGEATLGSASDHARWLEIAHRYLSNHCRGVFYIEPRNEFEQKHNEEKLSALQADQLNTLDRLFDANAGVFREIADSLLQKRTLARDDLAPFLDRVQLPEGFPRPSDALL